MPAKVLVIEDEHAIRDMIGFALSKAGMAYESAETVQDAERLIE